MIHNHYSAKLSALDLLMASHVPPGGNWKNIPVSVPSKRLEQIRESYAAGEGSRSTYYGRLAANKPSYTVSTYFNRLGNGCFLHYDFQGGQHRTISQREAARLQSFPDDFQFLGNLTAVNKQIGNAVPPLLAYQLALGFSEYGSIVDLFCGAGGLSLGFKWAGWKTVVANDIDSSFLKTYRSNFGDNALLGDLNSGDVVKSIIDAAKRYTRSGPLIVVGGPPCQGFSTAGKRRTMDDERNHLFKAYVKVLKSLSADGFIFENVLGLLSMAGGTVFSEINSAFAEAGYMIKHFVVDASEFNVPQRRKRIVIVGSKGHLQYNSNKFDKSIGSQLKSREVWSVADALGDLPTIFAGQDGKELDYKSVPQNDYQKFMRGSLSLLELLQPHEKADVA